MEPRIMERTPTTKTITNSTAENKDQISCMDKIQEYKTKLTEALLSAVQCGDHKTAEILLKGDADPKRAALVKKKFPLDWSRCRGLSERVIQVRTVPLIEACQRGDRDLVKLLLCNGADPFENLEDGEGCLYNSPFAEAMAEAVELEAIGRQNNAILRIVKDMIEFDPAKTRQNIHSLMHAAIISDNPKAIEMLLPNGGYVDMEIRIQDKNIDGTLLELAISLVSPCICHWLLNNGACANRTTCRKGMTPLMRASRGWCPHMVQELLQHGAEPAISDINDGNAFSYACEVLNWQAVLFLSKNLSEGDALISFNGLLDQLLGTWERAQAGYGTVNTVMESFVESITILILSGAGQNRKDDDLLRIVNTIVDKNADEGVNKLIEVLVMTASISRSQILTLYDHVRDTGNTTLNRSQVIMERYLKHGLTLQQKCRIKLRQLISPPLGRNVKSCDITLPRSLKEYIVGKDII